MVLKKKYLNPKFIIYNTNMEIIKARLKDAKDIARMYNNLRKHELALLPKYLRNIQTNWEIIKSEKDIKSLIRSRNFYLMIAIENHKIYGFINIIFVKGIKFLEGNLELYVKSEGRGKGIGTMLITESKKLCKDKKCKSVSISVYCDNPKAEKLYKKLGFRILIKSLKMKI